MLYYMTISIISQQREREQVRHTQELITKIIMHVKHSTYEQTPEFLRGENNTRFLLALEKKSK
jgi:hypothetical protein